MEPTTTETEIECECTFILRRRQEVRRHNPRCPVHGKPNHLKLVK